MNSYFYRSGYLSSKASHGNCSQFSGDGISGDFHPGAMYSSSSVLSSVPSTVSSKDSGVGRAQKGTKPQDGTRIVYYVEGEKYPYQSILPDKTVCLGQFKELIAFKKGHYRYNNIFITFATFLRRVFNVILTLVVKSRLLCHQSKRH